MRACRCCFPLIGVREKDIITHLRGIPIKCARHLFAGMTPGDQIPTTIGRYDKVSCVPLEILCARVWRWGLKCDGVLVFKFDVLLYPWVVGGARLALLALCPQILPPLPAYTQESSSGQLELTQVVIVVGAVGVALEDVTDNIRSSDQTRT